MDALKESGILAEVMLERERQDAKWGPQSWPDGTGTDVDKAMAAHYRDRCDAALANGMVTWRDIQAEELAEAYAETDFAKLRLELIQTMAVTLNWIRDIDERIAKRNGSVQ